MENIVITRVTESELPVLQAISRKTFSETFAEENSVEDLQMYLEQNLSLDQLRKELLDGFYSHGDGAYLCPERIPG